MELHIYNKVITTPLIEILKKVRADSHSGLLKEIINRGENLLVTCPFHKDGHEKHPSCSVYANVKGKLPIGEFHCFTCGKSGNLSDIVNVCFGKGGSFGNDWLSDNYGNVEFIDRINFPSIELSKKTRTIGLDPSILDKYKFFHPYMFQRKLKEEIIMKFSVGYDKDTDCIVFPVWDEHNNLVMLTRRSVKTKQFIIDKNVSKPVYLLNFAIQEQQKTIYITESQINALTLWGYGFPAVALIGTGTREQYDILNRCGIKHMILCLDGDDAGHSGTLKLLKNLSKDIFIEIKVLPEGKDVNDLSEQEFRELPLKI